jgi:hypothetical protein
MTMLGVLLQHVVQLHIIAMLQPTWISITGINGLVKLVQYFGGSDLQMKLH